MFYRHFSFDNLVNPGSGLGYDIVYFNEMPRFRKIFLFVPFMWMNSDNHFNEMNFVDANKASFTNYVDIFILIDPSSPC